MGLVDKEGGLDGLVAQLSKGGLGGAASSWEGKGPNKKVDGTQVRRALGKDHVKMVAKKEGVSEKEASDGLASILPKVVNALTPDGRIPKDLDLSKALGGLKGLLG